MLFTLAQLFGENGPTNDLEGFTTALIFCPLPLLLLGLVVGVAGRFIMRATR